jgi:hypothetical protein
VSTYDLGYLEGFRRWRGPFWLYRETLNFMGSAAFQKTAGFRIRENKIPPNFDTPFATSLEIIWQFKGLTA